MSEELSWRIQEEIWSVNRGDMSWGDFRIIPLKYSGEKILEVFLENDKSKNLKIKKEKIPGTLSKNLSKNSHKSS